MDEFFVSYKSYLNMRILSIEKIFHVTIPPDRSFEHCLNIYAGGNVNNLSPTNSDTLIRYVLYEMFKIPESAEHRERHLSLLAKS